MKYIDEALNNYEKHHDDVSKLMLEHYRILAQKNNLIVFLDAILKYNPNISLVDLDERFFSSSIYIENYGIDFVAQNIEDITIEELRIGINDLELKKRIMVISALKIPFNKINKNLIFASSIENDFFKTCKEIFLDNDLNKFINETFSFDSEDINYIYILANNPIEKKYFEFFVHNFTDINNQKYKLLIRHEKKYLDILVNVLSNCDINLNMDFQDFISFYDKNETLLKSIGKTKFKEIIECFKIYLNSGLDLDSVDELLNIKKLSYEHNRCAILKEDSTNKIKNIITNTYFSMSYKDFITLTNDVLKYASNILSEEEKTIMTTLFNESKKENILDLYDNLYKRQNIYNMMTDIENRYKDYCKEQLVNCLSKKQINQVVKIFDGEPFNFLVHKIKGHGDRDFANKISMNPSLWKKKYVDGGYISTSLISDLFLGTDDGPGALLGFNNITTDDILDMGPSDIYTSVKLLKSKRKNPKSKHLPPKDLIENTDMKYNEIAIKRFRNKEAIIPDFVLCFDRIDKASKRIAEYFDIPIYIIKKDRYITQMNDNLDNLLEEGKFQEYYNYRNKKYYSFVDNNEILSKEFSPEILQDEFIKLTIKMKEYLDKYYSRSKELELLRLLERLNNKNRSIIARNNYQNNENYKIDGNNLQKYIKLTKES